MKKYTLSIILLVFVFYSHTLFSFCSNHFLYIRYSIGQSYYSHDGSNVFSLKEASYGFFDRCKILTFLDGQVICDYDKKVNIRLKQDSAFESHQDKCFSVNKGTVGFWTKGIDISVSTPKVNVKVYDNSIVVVKETSVLTRICVVKGKALVVKGDKQIIVNQNQEIAASKNYLSKKYKRTAELRFTWYWTSPSKEPCFQ